MVGNSGAIPLLIIQGLNNYRTSPYSEHVRAFELLESASDVRFNQPIPNTIQDGFIIIGPPGTGKTYLIVRGCFGYLNNHQFYSPTARTPSKVMIMTYTNAAAFRVIEAFEEFFNEISLPEVDRIRLVRRIVSENIPNSLRKPFYDVARIRSPNQSEEDWQSTRSVIQNVVPILVGTIDTLNWVMGGAGDENRINGVDPSLILIDEASQIHVGQFNLGVNKGGIKFQAIGLIGDPAQLPPISAIARLQQSILNYLIGGGGRPSRITPSKIITLTTQFRMRSIINEFRKLFALGQINVQTDYSADVRRISTNIQLPPNDVYPNLLRILSEEKPIIIIDTSIMSYNEEQIGSSFINRQEAELSDKLGRAFLKSYPDLALEDEKYDLFLMSPFRPQANLMDEMSIFRAGTANSFQGQDTMVSIISMTKSASSNTMNNSLRFLEQDQRLNVLFSRSKVKIIVIIDRSQTSSSIKLNQIFTFAQDNQNSCEIIDLNQSILAEIEQWIV